MGILSTLTAWIKKAAGRLSTKSKRIDETAGIPYDDQVRRFTAISALATSEKVHPGYGGKPEPAICTDCVHFMTTLDEQAGCAHPQIGTHTNRINGRVSALRLCTAMRSDDGLCGDDGRLYAPNDEAIRRPVCKNLIRAPYQRSATTPACCVPAEILRDDSANPSKAMACSGCAFSPNSH